MSSALPSGKHALRAFVILSHLSDIVSEDSNTRVFIGGLFPLSGGWFSKLGDQCLQAALLAVDDINNNSDILSGNELVLVYNDTQGSTGQAMNIMFSYLHSDTPLPAVIGGLFSSPTIYAAEISGIWNVTQVSYAATAPTLSDRSRFPYFFRTISSANAFRPAYIEIMKRFNWNRVATIHENREPFQSVTRNLVLNLLAKNMTVVASEGFSSNPNKVLQYLKDKDARIIFGNFYESTAKKIFCEAHKLGLTGADIQWVVPGYYTPGWWEAPSTIVSCSRAEMLKAIEGYMTLGWAMMHQNNTAVTVSGMTPRVFRERMNSVYNSHMWSPGHQIPMANSYDAVWSVALALNASLDKILPQTLQNYRYKSKMADIIFRQFSEVNFVGVSGHLHFDQNGDRSGSFIIEQYRDGREQTIGVYLNHQGLIQWSKSNEQIWIKRGGKPPADSDNTVIQTTVVEINVGVFIAYSCFALIGVLLSFAFLAFNIYFRTLRVIKMSSPNLNNIILSGCVLSYVKTVLSGLEVGVVGSDHYHAVCQASVWVLSIGFTLAFGAMFSKTWRVYSIFTNRSLKKKSIKDRSLFIVVAVLVSIDVILLTLLQCIDPYYSTVLNLPEQRFPDLMLIKRPIVYACINENPLYWSLALYVWKGLLLIFGIFLTWQTRNVRLPGLNDSRSIGTCIYNVVIFSVIGVPLSHILKELVTTSYAIINGFILFCTTLTLCLVFFPKVIAVHKGETGVVPHSGITANDIGNEGVTHMAREIYRQPIKT